jgi:hypothetical protein
MGILKGMLVILALAAVVTGFFEILPPLMTNYSFEDDLKTVAMMDGGNLSKTDDDIRLDVLKKAKELALPIDEKQITVQHVGTPGMPAVYVAADYSVTVNFPGYTFDLHFTPSSGNKGF